jgi:hypothetical protein
MTWAVILVAWLATMPQLMPQQQSEFFNWAITTILPAVTLLFEGGGPAAQPSLQRLTLYKMLLQVHP